MIAEAIKTLLNVAKPEVKEINGESYLVSYRGCERIAPVDYEPRSAKLHSLDAVVKLVEQDSVELPAPLFVHVIAHDRVLVYSDFACTVADRKIHHNPYERFQLCEAVCDDISPFTDRTMNYDEAMVALRSMFIQNEGTEYLLDLLSSITEDASAKSEDNGLSQTVTVKKGISLVGRVEVKPRVPLKPFRTFLEVEQPASEFLLRILPEKNIHLREADGGVWKLAARRNVAAYFDTELKHLIDAEQVIVMI